MIGTHKVQVWPDPPGGPVDLTCLVETVTINHGRDDTTQQPAASTATLVLDLADDVLPASVDIGTGIRVTTTIGATVSTRFYGRVTDVDLTWDDAGEQTPNAGTGQILAAGILADLGRRVVGAEPWPVELDGARVARVFTLAGLPSTGSTVDPGAMSVIGRDVDATDALSIVQETAASASGIVWETRDGAVCYADANHRRNLTPAVTLDTCQIDVAPTWSRTLQGMTNDVSIGYGTPPAGGGDQPRVTASNAQSIAKYGRYAYQLGTSLAAAGDATSLAGILVARNATPVWVMPDLPVAVDVLDPATTLALLALDVHSLLGLTGLPVLAPGAPTSTSLWVEGWSERLAYGEHTIDLAVSGYCRTVPPPLWDDLPAAWLWDTLTPDMTWDSASCMGTLPSTGRWTDVPASTRWDTVPPAVTWNTWTATAGAAGPADARGSVTDAGRPPPHVEVEKREPGRPPATTPTIGEIDHGDDAVRLPVPARY